MTLPPDLQIRLAAFQWLREQVDRLGDVLPWKLLAAGFTISGERVPLVAQQGIFKPKILGEIPLTITTSPGGPYEDAFGPDGLLRYAYRGQDPMHRDNVGLRKAMAREVPLAYFHAIMKGKYLAAWPVYIVGDDPGNLRFHVALDDSRQLSTGLGRAVSDSGAGKASPLPATDERAPIRREYVTRALRVRLHQRVFRERVVAAYQTQCALCRLRHDELLDAAHIDPDSTVEGEPLITNGIALCKLHHAAYDSYFLTVRPDHVIVVRRSILEEEDGPMLLHGLKGLHDTRIRPPKDRKHWPDRARLERRWEEFKKVG